MKYINSDSQYDYYIDYFQGIAVNIKKDKSTQQIFYSSESVANILGFNNTSEMIESNSDITNAFLDGMNTGLVIKDF